MKLLANLYELSKTDRIALNYDGDTLSYSELWKSAQALAKYFEENYDNNRIVGIYGSKENEMVIGFFASILARKTYVTLPTNYPVERLEYIVEDCNLDVILNCTSEECPLKGVDVIDIDRLTQIVSEYNDSDYRLYTSDNLDDTALIIYTSGSTGMPKGVEISYKNLESLDDVNNVVVGGLVDGKKKTMRVMCMVSYSFVAGLIIYYTMGQLGATIYTIPNKDVMNLNVLQKKFMEVQPHFVPSTPSIIARLIAQEGFDEEHIPGMRRIGFGGEPVSVEFAQLLHSKFPNLEFLNIYGSTEVAGGAICCNITSDLIEEAEGYLPVSDGRLDKAYLVDDDNNIITEEGIVGEFAFTNESLVNGYYKDAKMTNEKFHYTEDGTRIYRTGDNGVIKNGYTYVIGRKDNMVKIGGNRIELEDVEANMRKCSVVENCAVVVVKDKNNIDNLAAAVVLNDKSLRDIDAFIQIKTEMSSIVEKYKIPQKIIFVDALPQNSHGKLNREKVKELVK